MDLSFFTCKPSQTKEKKKRCHFQKLDVTVELDGKEYGADEDILTENSQFFKSALKLYWQEGKSKEVKLRGGVVTQETFQALINHLQTGFLPLHIQNIEDVVRTASYLSMDDVVNECSRFISSSTNASNYEYMVELDRKYDLKLDLFNTYLLPNFDEIAMSDSLGCISFDTMLNAFSSCKMRVKSELVVFMAAFKWLQASGGRSKDATAALFEKIKLHNILLSHWSIRLPENQKKEGEVLSKLLRAYNRNNISRPLSSCTTTCYHHESPRNYWGGVYIIASSGLYRWMMENGKLEKIISLTLSWQARVTKCNDKVYILGGCDKNNSTNYCYNPVNNTLKKIAPMHLRRICATMCSYKGQVYAFGGCENSNSGNTSRCEVYTPEQDTWKITPDLPFRKGIYKNVTMLTRFDDTDCIPMLECDPGKEAAQFVHTYNPNLSTWEKTEHEIWTMSDRRYKEYRSLELGNVGQVFSCEDYLFIFGISPEEDGSAVYDCVDKSTTTFHIYEKGELLRWRFCWGCTFHHAGYFVVPILRKEDGKCSKFRAVSIHKMVDKVNNEWDVDGIDLREICKDFVVDTSLFDTLIDVISV